MPTNDPWAAVHLHSLIAEADHFTWMITRYFNMTTDPEVKALLNDVGPTVIAMKIKMQDMYRELDGK